MLVEVLGIDRKRVGSVSPDPGCRLRPPGKHESYLISYQGATVRIPI